MDSLQSKPNPAIDRLHYVKNVVGLVGFTVLFLYCAFLLFTTNRPNGVFVFAIVMFALLLTIIRSAKRVAAIRRILSTGQK